MDQTAQSDVPPWRAGLMMKCPRCGEGRLLKGFLHVQPVCSHCGLDLGAHDSGDGPAFFIMFFLCVVIAPLALWLDAATQWPIWLNVVISSVIGLGVGLAMLRPAKGLLIGLNYQHRGLRNQKGGDVS